MPTWHPAALLRDENKKIEFWRDLKLVIKRYEELEKITKQFVIKYRNMIKCKVYTVNGKKM